MSKSGVLPPGAETLNGRLAMLGFVSALLLEFFTGQGGSTLFQSSLSFSKLIKHTALC